MITQKKLGKKIKDLREDFGFNQEQLAKKAGLSRAALSQIEIGNRGLNVLELAKIAKVFKVTVDFLLRDEEPAKIKDRVVKKANKNIKFNKEKLENVILYILEKCGGKPNVGETVLYKLLYFIDFDSYELKEESITGMNYVKLQYGPVPRACEYRPVIDGMIKDKKIKVINQNYHNRVQKRYIALCDSDISFFKPQQIKIVDEVISRLSNMNASNIEDYVHDDMPWMRTRDQKIIDYNLVFYRTPKYSQRDYNIELQNVSAKDYLTSEEISQKEYDYYENLK